MDEKKSESLKRFKELINKDNRRIASAKREKEKRNLFLWFVDNCPSIGGPELAQKFKDYGYTFAYELKRLKSNIIDSIGLKKDLTYRYVTQGNEMEALIDEIEKLYSSRTKKIIFFSKGEGGEMDSLFIRIRNSFAHGNYFKKRDYYFLWNETGKGTEKNPLKLGSFMVLKYEDLKNIYDLLAG